MISIAAGILLLPLIITSVGSGEYGVWLILVAVAAYLQMTDLGVGAAIIHFHSRARGGKESYGLSDLLSAATAWNAVAAMVVIPIFAFGAHAYLSSSTVTDLLTPDEQGGLLWLSLVAVGVMLLRPFDAALISRGLLPRERAHFSIGLLVRIVGTIAVCLLAPSVLAVAAVEVVGLLIPSLLSAIATVRSGVRISWGRHTFRVLVFIMRFSTRAFGAGAVGLLILQGGTILAGVILSPQDATYYNAAFRVYQGVRNLASWTTQPFRSAQSRLFASDPGQALRLVLTVSLSSLLTAAAASIAIAISTPFLVSVWLGADVPSESISLTTIILLAGVVLNSVHGPLVSAGDAAGRPGIFIPIQILWLVLFVALAYVLGPTWGIVGIATALSAPLILVECVYLVRAGGLLGFRIRRWLSEVLWPATRVLLAPIACSALAWLLIDASATSPLSMIPSLVFVAGVAVAVLARNRRDENLRRVADLLKIEL